MEGKSLYDFYESFLLPQFGIKDVKVEWSDSEDVGPDESIHYFSANANDYALIFEDCGGFGCADYWVKENVKLKDGNFEYVNPTSNSNHAPSYRVKFPTPYQYCVNVTGSFTLVKL